MTKNWTWSKTGKMFDRKLGRDVPVRIDLEFDLHSIAAKLGGKALLNKSGKSKLAIGIKAEAKILE